MCLRPEKQECSATCGTAGTHAEGFERPESKDEGVGKKLVLGFGAERKRVKGSAQKWLVCMWECFHFDLEEVLSGAGTVCVQRLTLDPGPRPGLPGVAQNHCCMLISSVTTMPSTPMIMHLILVRVSQVGAVMSFTGPTAGERETSF